jgi:hypothetical protein
MEDGRLRRGSAGLDLGYCDPRLAARVHGSDHVQPCRFVLLIRTPVRVAQQVGDLPAAAVGVAQQHQLVVTLACIRKPLAVHHRRRRVAEAVGPCLVLARVRELTQQSHVLRRSEHRLDIEVVDARQGSVCDRDCPHARRARSVAGAVDDSDPEVVVAVRDEARVERARVWRNCRRAYARPRI